MSTHCTFCPATVEVRERAGPAPESKWLSFDEIAGVHVTIVVKQTVIDQTMSPLSRLSKLLCATVPCLCLIALIAKNPRHKVSFKTENFYVLPKRNL
jgi:hypothetical protein